MDSGKLVERNSQQNHAQMNNSCFFHKKVFKKKRRHQEFQKSSRTFCVLHNNQL